MNKDEATIKINPIDDIQFVLEDSAATMKKSRP